MQPIEIKQTSRLYLFYHKSIQILTLENNIYSQIWFGPENNLHTDRFKLVFLLNIYFVSINWFNFFEIEERLLKY